MSTLQIIACGQIKEPYLRDGIAEFKKRLSRYTRVDITEVPDGSDSLPLDVQLDREGADIVAKLPPRAFIIALDIRGKTVDSEGFAELVERGFETGDATLCFIIGGSRGLAPAVLSRADLRLSLSSLTFPHQLTRLILLEQCYRAFRINRGEPYHK
ncbi:MAG TPA: 23S rRNA (pseudouridine(1915)-N(3))-methyltransferase RlmH [Clostridiaceae bacterium]|jgi:23S rRNA (pseudouridine1915-N3)-methyltransferase|nr:23S rRNA (pseudouridine(1915)-N(3))-methyltransferase RlmH [Clostridiaceae bacterium]